MTCTLYLMRHGIAAEPQRGSSDAERPLTDEGVRKTTRVAQGLHALGVAVDLILTSPFRRAAETAHLVADVLHPRLPVTSYPPLAAGATPQAVLNGLDLPPRVTRLMLVGHQPDLGELASYLLTGSASLAPLAFRKAAVAAINTGALPPRRAGVLDWFLTPSLLRAIAERHK